MRATSRSPSARPSWSKRSTPGTDASATRTVAYVRVSTEKQADHGVSLDAQQAEVNAYASRTVWSLWT